MTEDEAATARCFQAATFGASQQLADGPGPNCIASACMAWRWKFEQTNRQPYNAGTWPMAEPIYRQTEHGYCGLAGGPR